MKLFSSVDFLIFAILRDICYDTSLCFQFIRFLINFNSARII